MWRFCMPGRQDYRQTRENSFRANQGDDFFQQALAKRMEMKQATSPGELLEVPLTPQQIREKVANFQAKSKEDSAFEKLLQETRGTTDEPEEESVVEMADFPSGPGLSKAKASAKKPAAPPSFAPPAAPGKRKKAPTQSECGRAASGGAGGGAVKVAASEKADQELLARYHKNLSILEILSGNTKKGELYQCRRHIQKLEKKGQDEECSKLEKMQKVGTAALMLTPAESCKLPKDQLEAPWLMSLLFVCCFFSVLK
eukprot:s1246_g4.t1